MCIPVPKVIKLIKEENKRNKAEKKKKIVDIENGNEIKK
jgi:hypothetical protein